MTTTQQRMVPLSGGRRQSITLEDVTWRAIEWLAETERKTWQRWCADVILQNPGAPNVTKEVRMAALEGLMAGSAMAERAELAQRPQPALLALSATFNDADFEATLQSAQAIDGTLDMLSFEVITGVDDFGRVCLWLRNHFRDGPHAVIPLPFTPEALETALEVN